MHFCAVFNWLFCSRLEAASDVLSSVPVEFVDMDVDVKFCDPWWNRSRDVRAAHFVLDDELTTNAEERRRLTQVIT